MSDIPVPRWLDALGSWGWRLVAGTAGLVVVGYVLLKLAVLVVPVVLALFLATVLEPLATRLRRRGVKPALAALIVFLGTLAVLAGAVAWISTSVAGEMGDVVARAEQGRKDVQRVLSDKLNLSAEELDRIIGQAVESARTAGEGGLAKSVIGGARMAVQGVGGFVLMLFTLFFFLKDGPRMLEWIRDRAPLRYQDDLLAVGRGGQTVLRRYFIAIGLTGFVDATLIAVALLVVGVPLVGPLALLTFLGAFVPIIGAFVAGLLATLVALVTNGPGDALLVLAATVVVQQIEGNVLQPFIFGPVVRLHELVTVLAVAAGLAVGGVLGAFLAVPIVALAVNIGHFYRTRHYPEPGMPDAAPPEPAPPEPAPAASATTDSRPAGPTPPEAAHGATTDGVTAADLAPETAPDR